VLTGLSSADQGGSALAALSSHVPPCFLWMIKLASILGKEARGPLSLTIRWLHVLYNVMRIIGLAVYTCMHLKPGEETLFFCGVTWIGWELIVFSVRDSPPYVVWSVVWGLADSGALLVGQANFCFFMNLGPEGLTGMLNKVRRLSGSRLAGLRAAPRSWSYLHQIRQSDK
jgi:hypothetical protein